MHIPRAGNMAPPPGGALHPIVVLITITSPGAGADGARSGYPIDINYLFITICCAGYAEATTRRGTLLANGCDDFPGWEAI
jgi:hypothetical protein